MYAWIKGVTVGTFVEREPSLKLFEERSETYLVKRSMQRRYKRKKEKEGGKGM